MKVNVTLLKEMGLHVTLAVLSNSKDELAGAPGQDSYLEGVEFVRIEEPVPRRKTLIGRLTRQLSLEGWFPVARYAPALKDLVNRIKPEIVIAYSHLALPALRQVRNTPLLFVITQPPRLNYLYQTLLMNLSSANLVGKLKLLLQLPVHYWFLRRFELQIAGWATHVTCTDITQSRHYTRLLGRECSRYRSPTPDILTNRPLATPKKEGNRIVCVGKLAGTQSTSAFILLQDRLLGLLDARFGDKYSVHLLGGTALQRRVAKLARHPRVFLRGHIADVEPELRAADVILVANTLPFGYSARVRTALCVGAVIVVHTAVTRTIPELRHEHNCLVGRTPQELVDAIERCFTDTALTWHLRGNARATYEKCFSPEAARGDFEALVNRTLREASA